MPNDRAEMARILVRLRFDDSNPDYNIRKALDEPVEQVVLADFYNGPAAEWLARETEWMWLPIRYSDLSKIKTIRDLAKLCYAHLAAKPTEHDEVAESIFGDDDE